MSMTMKWMGTRSLALLLGALLSACSSSDSPAGPGAEPTFELALASGALTVNAGGSGTVTVTVTRSGGFTGEVAIAVEGLPQGVTAGALTIPGSGTSAILTLTAGAGATPGSSNLTVRGTAAGAASKTAALGLTIAAAGSPEITLTLGSANAAVAAGGSTQVQVTIARLGGFVGGVSLAAAGLPAGVTAAFNPTTIAAGATTSTLTLTAVGGAAASSTSITVGASGAGVAPKSATLSLQVTSGGGSGSIAWTFCGLSGIPTWLAVQDGNGPWNRVNGTNGTFRFDVGSPRGGVAWVTQVAADQYELELFYGTREEIPLYGADICDGSEGSGKTVTATVSGLQLTDMALLSLGGALPTVAPTSTSPAVTFSNVPNGPVDLFAGVTGINLQTFSLTPRKFIVRRGLNPAAGSALQPIDFGSAEAFDPAQSALTVNNLGGQMLFTTVAVRTSGGAFAPLYAGTGSNLWYGLPANRIVAGDLHMVIASATAAVDELGPSRTTVRLAAQPQALAITLGPELTVPVAQSVAGVGQVRARAEYAIQANYSRYWLADFQQNAAGRSATVHVTSGYRGNSSGTVALEVPEFDGVAGWTGTWGLRPGATTVWTVSASGWTQSGGTVAAPWVDGAEYVTASQQGQF